MEKNTVISNPMSVCERIFKAVSVNPVQTIRHITYRPLDVMPASTAAPNTSKPTLDPSVKSLHSPSKAAALGQRQSETPEKTKAAEVVPIDFERSILIQFDDTGVRPRSDMKEKSEMQQVSIQNHRQAAVKIEPVIPQGAAVKESKTKPQVQMIQSTKKPVIRSDEDQVDKFTTKMPPKQPHVPVEERTQLKEEMAARTKVVLDGQGAKVTPKVGDGTVHVLEKDSPAKIVKDQPFRDKTGEQGKKSGQHNSNDKFSDYINRAKLKIRTTSDVGIGKNTPRVDSLNEKVTNFIDRAKFKIRSSSNIGGGKSVSFK